MKKAPPSIENFKQRISWAQLDKELIRKHLALCVEEDLGKSNNSSIWKNDITTTTCSISNSGFAKLVSREPLILCGIQLIPYILSCFGTSRIEFSSNFEDGDIVGDKDSILSLEGPINEILSIERCLLNFIQKLSGIATATNRYVKLIEVFGVSLLDTRKTTPGIRLLEKYATACGGGYNHRIGLYDRILIKDNHLESASANNGQKLKDFLKRIVYETLPKKIVQVELDSLSQLGPALESGVDAILLDNFEPAEIKTAVEMNNNQVVLEVSGGITESTIEKFAEAKPHFISSGAPIHSSRWVDLGLDLN